MQLYILQKQSNLNQGFSNLFQEIFPLESLKTISSNTVSFQIHTQGVNDTGQLKIVTDTRK